MLDDQQIWELAERMNIPLTFCNFKDKLKTKKLKYNASYIVNMEDMRMNGFILGLGLGFGLTVFVLQKFVW